MIFILYLDNIYYYILYLNAILILCLFSAKLSSNCYDNFSYLFLKKTSVKMLPELREPHSRAF